MEQTCGNCKYRGKDLAIEHAWDEDQAVNAGLFFVCNKIDHLRENRWSQTQKWEVEDPECDYMQDPPDLVAYVEDGSGYHAALCVSTDFGCNQWELKDT